MPPFLLLLVAVIDTGKLFPLRLGVLRLAVFSAAVLLLWRGRDEEPELDLYPLIVGGFVFLSLGHAFSSIYPWVSMQHALNIAMTAVILGWVYRVVRKDPDRAQEWVFFPICAIAVLQFVVALYQRFAAGNFRPRGTFDNTNFFAEYMAIAGMLCLSRSREEERSKIRMMCAAGAVLFLVAALGLSASRAVLIAVVPAVGILLLWRFGWRKGGVFLLAGGIPAFAILGYQAATRFTSPDPYNYTRLVMWKSAVRIFQSYPFGIGLGVTNITGSRPSLPSKGRSRNTGSTPRPLTTSIWRFSRGWVPWGWFSFCWSCWFRCFTQRVISGESREGRSGLLPGRPAVCSCRVFTPCSISISTKSGW